MPIKSLSSFTKLSGVSFVTSRSYATAASFTPALLSTMTTSPVTTREEFLASAKLRLLADPVVSLGYQPPEKRKPIPFILQPSSEEEPVIVSNNVVVPLSKSLRYRLNLPINPIVAPSATDIPRVRIVGHRGNLFEEPENTRPGFLSCVGICDAVELDVFLLKDGNLVIFHGTGNHDDRPGLLAGYIDNADEVKVGATSILDLTLEETRQLKFNVNYAGLPAPADKLQRGNIPTLEEVLLDLQPTGMEVKIELKGPETAMPVLELVDRLNMVDQVSYSSFQLHEIETVRKLKPQRHPDGGHVYRTGALFSEVPADYLEKARAVGASTVHLRYDECSTDRVRDIHAAGMGTMCWTPGPIAIKNDSEKKYWDVGNEDEVFFDTVMATGVQEFCTNRPKLLFDMLQGRAIPGTQSRDVNAAALA